MRTNFDFTPYRRSTVGFENLFDLLESSTRAATVDNYPPFDIERSGDDAYRITIAVAGLGGVRFPRWFMNSAMAVYAVGLGFAYWLFFQAYFVIGAMCPWCLLITATTTTVFASLLRVNLSDNTFGLSPRAHDRALYLLRIGADIWGTILIIAILAAMVIVRYL